MKQRSFIFLALWLPVLLSVMLYLLVGHAKLAGFVYWNAIYSVIGHLQYAIFLILFHGWLYLNRIRNITHIVWWLPLVFAPYCMLYSAIYLAVKWSNTLGGFALSVLYKDGFSALVMGYAYVIAIQLLTLMLTKIGFLKK